MIRKGKDIDVVITWVDGQDLAHRAKRAEYTTDKKETQREDIGGATRFDSVGEIYFSVSSLLRFAPFVRKIFIVTDNQNPQLESLVAEYFPSTRTQIEIVDHRVIFEGYEEYLPVFNSLSIETMLWRIPGLSQRYVYLNDDNFLLSEHSVEQWFEGEKLVSFGEKFSSRTARFLRWIKPRKNGHKTFGYKDAMVNAADLVGAKSFRLFPHAPTSQLKSLLAEFFEKHPEAMIQNIAHRFRDPSQYNPQTLCQLLAEEKGLCEYKSVKKHILFVNHCEREGYIARKLREAENSNDLMMGCANSLDRASQKELRLFKEWLSDVVGVKALQN